MDRRTLLVRTGLVGTAAIGSAWLAGCSADRAEPEPTDSTGTPPTTPAAEPSSVAPEPTEPRLDGTIASGLAVPWAIGFLADGSALVTQRDEASIVRVEADGTVTAIGDVAGVAPAGEGGLQGLAIGPDESELFVYVTTEQDNRVLRLGFDGERITEVEPVLTGLAKAYNHQGGGLTFDRDGNLFVAVGDAANPDVAQDRDALNGKILRITTDGAAVDGNPFGTRVWSLGHRNVEGLAWDARGRLWATEFGDQSADELNRIRRGGNYGWPVAEGTSDRPGLVQPRLTWTTDEASPAGLAISGDRAFVAALRGQRLWEVDLSSDAPARDFLVGDLGRLRSVALAPDGSLWVGTSNRDGRAEPRRGDDRLVRVVIQG